MNRRSKVGIGGGCTMVLGLGDYANFSMLFAEFIDRVHRRGL